MLNRCLYNYLVKSKKYNWNHDMEENGIANE